MDESTINNLDISQYPKLLKTLEDLQTDLTFDVSATERKINNMIVESSHSVDSCGRKYKTKEERQTAIDFLLLQNQDYQSLQNSAERLRKELAKVKITHAEVRRMFRILENDFTVSGVRKYSDIK